MPDVVHPPVELGAGRWAHARPVADLAQPEILRGVMDALGSRLDGQQAAGRTTQRKRAVLSNALSYAVELGLLVTNPVGSITWRAPKTNNVVEKECVPNPTQARALLAAVKATPRSGERLYAFFTCIYFSALRPEEAVNLRRSNVELPETGWGRIILREATPDAGGQWTDDGAQRQRRQLKHRARRGDSARPLPA